MRALFLGGFFVAASLATWLRPALADLIDAEAKPYLVSGGWIGGLLFTALSLFYIQKGVRYRSVSRSIAGWPTTDATVIASAVVERVFRDAQGYSAKRYIPDVRYVYDVDGARRENNVLKIGLGDLGYMLDSQAREHARLLISRFRTRSVRSITIQPIQLLPYLPGFVKADRWH